MTATLFTTTSFLLGYSALNPSAAEVRTATASVTATFGTTLSSTQQALPSTPLAVASFPQVSGFVALISWGLFAGALIWRGHVRSLWGRSRFSYETFRLLVRMRGAQTRLRLMHSLSEPRNKLQLATSLGIDWKAVDKHVQMLQRNGLIYVTATSGTSTFYELTDKGKHLLQVLQELGTEAETTPRP